MPRDRWVSAFALCASLAIAACSDRTAPPSAPPASKPTYVNRVWRVTSSSSIEPGMLYVFLSDGTLVMTSPHGTPALASWKPAGEGLLIVEEGRTYRVNVLKLSADEFRIMIDNPGNAVEIAFAPADAAPPATGAPGR